MSKMLNLSVFSLILMGIDGRSYTCELPKAPPVLTSGLGAGFISETPVIISELCRIHGDYFKETRVNLWFIYNGSVVRTWLLIFAMTLF